MNPFEFAALAVVTLSVAAVVVVERIFSGIRRVREQELAKGQERQQELEARILELERHNDDLRQQLDWSKRLVEAQDRLLQQAGAPPARLEPPSRV
jgi:flagellar biosynthesis/type III secretory pathway M-ring protein FliF/YscJ